ncbi:MFS general substrate transporter [Astrocystis sublimbata]|nr:MFS general substrate transporter [Astrocystis sublimbata]
MSDNIENGDDSPSPTGAPAADHGTAPTRGWRFWAIFVALSITSLLAAIESTVTSTAMPVIAEALDAGDLYVWFVNAYTLPSAALLPLYGQVADIFGRRWLTIVVVAIFAIGSGISGGANSPTMLIAGRAVQGAGGGGIILMIEMIICDLVPLRERAKYNRQLSIADRLRRIDYIGNVVMVASVTAILIALTYGGTRFPWSSWRVLLPLLLGFAGLGVFIAFESSRWCADPMTPPHLFRNRTSAAAFFLTFTHSLFSFWVLYFLPVYFQAAQLYDPIRSGVLLLPTVVVIVPGGLISGVLLSKFGRYGPIHMAAFALMALGAGLLILLDQNSAPGLYIGLQFIGGLGSGLALSTLLPAVQAPLEEKDTASSSATWVFIRTFGTVWGVSIPAAILNSRCDALASRIDDLAVRNQIAHGQCYAHGTSAWVQSLEEPTRDIVTGIFSDGLKTVWAVATAIVGVSFFAIFVEKEIKLRDSLETEYGMEGSPEHRKKEPSSASPSDTLTS